MEKKDVKIEDSGINQDVLEIMAQDNVLKAIESNTEMKRIMLNAAAENLSLVKDINKQLDQIDNLLAICASEKVLDFFGKVKENLEKEQSRVKTMEKIELSHKKPTTKQ